MKINIHKFIVSILLVISNNIGKWSKLIVNSVTIVNYIFYLEFRISPPRWQFFVLISLSDAALNICTILKKLFN